MLRFKKWFAICTAGILIFAVCDYSQNDIKESQASNMETQNSLQETVEENSEKLQEKKTIINKNEVIKMNMVNLFESIANQNVVGEGYICWEKWKDLKNNGLISGNIYVPLIDDVVYTSMKLPSEVQTFMKYRTNPAIMSYRPSGYNRAVGIGAVYQSTGTVLPDEFNVCLGRFMVFVLKDSENAQWEILDVHEPLDMIEYFQLRRLPWTEVDYYRPTEKTVFHDDYVEFKLTKEDLDNGVLHFYGMKQPCISDDVIGFVTIFDVWSDTEGIDGKLACEIGVDQWNSNGECKQAYFGRNYAIMNEHRLMIGHNMPDAVYEELVAEGKSPSICVDMFLNYTKDN